MKGDKKVIQLLNRQLTRELTAVNQYFLHALMQTRWGLEKLGKHEYRESIEEMQHADSQLDLIGKVGLENYLQSQMNEEVSKS